ncbi:MAG: Hpt domain-containing protein [Deltaproteobacteria bacterium]
MLIYGTVLLNILRTSIIFDVELTSCRLYISLPQRRRVLGCGFKSADFLVEMPKQLMLMKEFVERGQAKQAGVQAHKIRGAAGNIGSPALQEIAHAMEQAGTAEEINLLRTLMPEMEKQFELLKEAMEASEP